MDQFLTGEVFLYYIIGIVLADCWFKIYMGSRQIRVYRTTKNVPHELKKVLDENTFNNARLYGLDRMQYAIFKLIIDAVFETFVLFFGLIAYVWELAEQLTEKLTLDSSNEIIVSCVFLVALGLITLIPTTAFDVYRNLVIEEKYGFNKQSVIIIIIENVVTFLIIQVIVTSTAAAIVFLIQEGGEYFFFWLWLFTLIVSLILASIFPILISHLLMKFDDLEASDLKESIEELADEVGYPLDRLFFLKGSQRTAHSNAFFYGFACSKMLVIFDTLLIDKNEVGSKAADRSKRCTNEEILAIIAHELGHWKLGHITKNIIIIEVNLLIVFAVYGYLHDYGPFYEAVGFEPGKKPILVGLVVIMTYVMAPYNAVFGVCMTMISRRFEYQADEFAFEMGYSKPLQTGLIKLYADNLEFPVYDWLYSTLYHTHPTLLERLARLKQLDRRV